jgi:hypothetical protein
MVSDIAAENGSVARPEQAPGLAEENRRIRELQRVVALAAQVIATQIATREEALTVIGGARRRALALFPGSGDTFDLIYHPRLMRIWQERNPLNGNECEA